MNNNLHISYRINGDDEIIFVNDNWSQFALANDAPEFVAEKVLNRGLWEFITDDTTIELYRDLVAKARSAREINFNFRCDSPDARRLLRMTINLLENDSVQFDTRTIWTEKRNPQNVLQKDVPPSDDILLVCSWCKKIDVQNGDWQEIEEAISNLGLFELDNFPQLSHGMCLACYQTITESHQNRFGLKPAQSKLATSNFSKHLIQPD